MASFTKLNDDNIVVAVLSVHDDVATNEQAGIDFLTNLFSHSNWKQTYKDAFIEPQPYNSWTLDNDTCRWIAPTAYPSDASITRQYDWNEDSTSWVLIER